MDYRPEIDGLRAIAVVPVVLFHSGFSLFSGGYVGVDVFFVISGFLISSILLSELDDGSFRLSQFYERRARRILPALFFVVTCSSIGAWFILLPSDARDYSQSVIATALFASNFLFWFESGYFDTAAEFKPLLHTWSLSVEEQFYILFPLFLAFLHRNYSKNIPFVLCIIAAMSFLLSESLAEKHSSANFYLLPTRAWELLTGTFAAIIVRETNEKKAGWMRDLLVWFGFGLIAVSVFTYDSHTPFPGRFTVVPVLGTFLILVFAETGMTSSRLLAHRWLVAIGLISYSLYLWHQPVLVFSRHLEFVSATPLQDLALVIVAFLLALFSYHYVEKPFRSKTLANGQSKKRTLLKFGSGLFALSAMGALVYFVPSFVELKHPEIFRQAKVETTRNQYSVCDGFTEKFSGAIDCRRYGEGSRQIVIWGDSHARALRQGINDTDEFTIYVISHAGCPPAVGVFRIDVGAMNGFCSRENQGNLLVKYIRSLRAEYVVFVARWTLYQRGRHIDQRLQTDTHFLVASEFEERTVDAETSTASLRAAILGTARYFSDSKVVFVRQPPDLVNIPRRRAALGRSVEKNSLRSWHLDEIALTDELTSYGFVVIDPWEKFCGPDECFLSFGDNRIYTDDNHLSYFGANLLVNFILERFENY